jgi:hypothetical protein
LNTVSNSRNTSGSMRAPLKQPLLPLPLLSSLLFAGAKVAASIRATPPAQGGSGSFPWK